ncbi:hypothetical protein C7212DRAFT_226105 [Tuber magnatum]|uniref:Uncharacterized protein n=1 Tax=Tuber magnatum TaxID=42249 RepID=A0A317SGW8_9PEZI|nr:hypothetical protein C7212DRAFT_226105 [Tuber magnatum]
MEPNLAPRVCLRLQDAALGLSGSSSKIITSVLLSFSFFPAQHSYEHSTAAAGWMIRRNLRIDAK